jgi:DNA polymerase I
LAHLHDENYSEDGAGNKEGYSLDNCCARYGVPGKQKSMEFELMLNLVGWNGLDFDSIREYAAGDTLATYLLWEAIMRKIKKEPFLPTYWKKIEAPNLHVLKSMRELGVKVNLPLAIHLEGKGQRIMTEIENEIGVKFSGNGSRKAVETLFWETLGLPQILNKRTGKPTLDKEAMKRYDLILERQNNPIAKKLLEFRGWQKSVTSFYRPYQEHVWPDGRIRTDFKPHGTVTGRYSSSKPNLQQIPKESDKEWNGQAKDCFMPEDGYELWEFDYSQLEFRLSASYAREPKLLDVFNDDSRDIFDEMSLDLGLSRQQCKTLTYSIQYGAGAQRIMDVFGYSRAQAVATINSWYDNYPGIRRVSDQGKEMAKKFGKVELWSGRFRHFHHPASESRKAFNSTIQGGAADMVKVTMNNIAREMPELRMVLQVHDALWFEIPKSEVAHYLPQIKTVMEHPTEKISRVQLKVDGHRVGTIL